MRQDDQCYQYCCKSSERFPFSGMTPFNKSSSCMKNVLSVCRGKKRFHLFPTVCKAGHGTGSEMTLIQWLINVGAKRPCVNREKRNLDRLESVKVGNLALFSRATGTFCGATPLIVTRLLYGEIKLEMP